MQGSLHLTRPLLCGVSQALLPPRMVALRRVQTVLLAASISHPPGSADAVNGPETECKIKTQQINGCKSHLEPITRTTSRLWSQKSSTEAELAGGERMLDCAHTPHLCWVWLCSHWPTLLEDLQGHPVQRHCAQTAELTLDKRRQVEPKVRIRTLTWNRPGF